MSFLFLAFLGASTVSSTREEETRSEQDRSAGIESKVAAHHSRSSLAQGRKPDGCCGLTMDWESKWATRKTPPFIAFLDSWREQPLCEITC